MSESVRESAPAKVNLALAVTGRRADGYHLIDSIVTFADIADEVVARPGTELSLSATGRQAGAIAPSADNLALAAARRLQERPAGGDRPSGASLQLSKRLPVAAGLGGGSADAAASLRALNRLWKLGLGPDELAKLGAELGADVAMCVHSAGLRARGIGERIDLLPQLPVLDLVLVNPQVPVPTAGVFAGLARRDGDPLPDPPRLAGFEDAAFYLGPLRNDLTEPAIGIAPVIGLVLEELEQSRRCRLARMSGSGATCFGLFPNRGAAVTAAVELAARHPDWWVVATRTLSGAG